MLLSKDWLIASTAVTKAGRRRAASCARRKKKKKSKVPAKPGHANPRYGSKFHYSRGAETDAEAERSARRARLQHAGVRERERGADRRVTGERRLRGAREDPRAV